MSPTQVDKLIWLSENATQEEYETYWDEVQEEHGHSSERMAQLIGLRVAVNRVFREDN